MNNRDVNYQVSNSQAFRQDSNNTASNFITGVSSNYRTYDPSSSRFSAVAPTRAGSFDPQKSFSNISGTGRYSAGSHSLANSSSTSANANRISYLAPSASRPNAYFWAQPRDYSDSIKAAFANQSSHGLSFYRLSDGNKVIVDQFKNDNYHWFYYNRVDFDNNLLTFSNTGAVSKIEVATNFQDRTDTPTTPLFFQTHGGMPQDGQTTWRTDYSRDSWSQADDRETYMIYRPSYGSNTQLPTNIETLGEWTSNIDGGRSGRWR